MAKTKKKDNLKGFIDGKSHFTMEGKDIVKNSSAPDPERLANDPVYAPVRKNYNLFGSLSGIATAFRAALKPTFESAMDKRMSGSLTAFFRTLVADGREVLDLRAHKDRLCNYTFKKKHIFNATAALVPYAVTCAEDRSRVTLQLHAFKRTRLKDDKNRTHFRMTLAVMPFANSFCTSTEDSITYMPVENPYHGSLLVAESADLDICFVEQEQQVTVQIPEKARDTQVSLVVFLHLAFYERVNEGGYMQANDVLKVAEVY
ncbi:MAG: hypothetical protein ACTHJT_00820 [Cytophaga sp.]|uniref:hypothetical protein n=1 Tax=Cytophaga sp. TaxID=29535 RepID=UPI003F80076C